MHPPAAPTGDLDPLEHVARNHAHHRTVVIAEYQLLYLPVPKTGWTSTLWALAGLAGLTAADFARSVKPEVSATMAVHDEAVWARHGRLLRALDTREREEATEAPGWLRFSVVRDPTRRLWSAWESKFLLREPVYYGFHHERAWYPRRPRDPLEVVDDFRAFVHALADGFATDSRMRDPHWGRQSDVIRQLALNHVGRTERLADTETRLTQHLAARGGPAVQLARENAMPLPFSPALLDRETTEIIGSLYATDFETFGYPPPEPLHGAAHADALREWCAGAAGQFTRMNELIDRHERLYAVVSEFRDRLRRAERESSRSAAEAAALREELDRARERNRRMRQSLSWRITAPARRARAWPRRHRRT